MSGITWKTLEEVNKLRLPEFKNKHGEKAHSEPDGSDWSLSDWAVATGGEFGEFQNILKKFKRGDLTEEEFKKEGGYELADTVIYLSILAYRCGIDMDKAIVEKFNIVSDRVGSNVFIDFEFNVFQEQKRYYVITQIGKKVFYVKDFLGQDLTTFQSEAKTFILEEAGQIAESIDGIFQEV